MASPRRLTVTRAGDSCRRRKVKCDASEACSNFRYLIFLANTPLHRKSVAARWLGPTLQKRWKDLLGW
ncbi:hypothetical protein B0O99DRAFT_77328 [Bisporella sp. PMI_857]|nr:hypothetical protein B0O99DRAFT_77328 [Bisporella sp. PMI_857]